MMKKMLYFGLGALNMTREKAEKFFTDLEEKGEVSKEEAKRFVEEAIKRGEEDKAVVKEMISKEWRNMKEELPFVKRAEYEVLLTRVEALEAKFDQEGSDK